MSPRLLRLLIWAPRLAGVLVTLFVAMFALDAFDGGPLTQTLPAFVIHLIPAAIVGLVVAVAWRHPWVGAAGFGALAVAYAVSVPSRPDWILAISGPLAVTSVLFAVSARRRGDGGAPASV
jgi:hypothetical protein